MVSLILVRRAEGRKLWQVPIVWASVESRIGSTSQSFIDPWKIFSIYLASLGPERFRLSKRILLRTYYSKPVLDCFGRMMEILCTPSLLVVVDLFWDQGRSKHDPHAKSKWIKWKERLFEGSFAYVIVGVRQINRSLHRSKMIYVKVRTKWSLMDLFFNGKSTWPINLDPSWLPIKWALSSAQKKFTKHKDRHKRVHELEGCARSSDGPNALSAGISVSGMSTDTEIRHALWKWRSTTKSKIFFNPKTSETCVFL